jgi:predicted dehydrogenase
MFVANYLTQDLYFYENAEIAGSNWETLRILRGVSEGSMTRFALQRKEPLVAEQEAFLAAINGDDRHIVRGRDGLEALRLALALIESGQTHDVIHLAAEPIC